MKAFTYLFILMTSVATAQNSLSVNPNLNAIVKTERAFAKMAKDQNTRDAFLFYLSDDVITSGINGPVRGKDHIKNQKADASWLYWDVAYSDVSQCGDMGFNTGPWEFRANKDEGTPVAFGEFNSIWKKQGDGTWKNVLDIGVNHGQAPPVDSIKLTTSVLLNKEPEFRVKKIIGKESLINAEQDFQALSILHRRNTYLKYLSTEARIIYSNQLPIITADAKEKFLQEGREVSNIKMIATEISQCFDMGYVYGTADVKIETKDKTETKLATYFRVWKKEDNRSWKIVLDVLSY